MSRPDSPPIHMKMVSALPPAEVPAGLPSPSSQSQPVFPKIREEKEVRGHLMQTYGAR